MQNTIFIVVIILVVLRCLGLKVEILLLHLIGRCLMGIVVLYVCNFLLSEINQDLIVNINEITLLVSSLLGMPGIIFLYFLRWFLLIIP